MLLTLEKCVSHGLRLQCCAIGLLVAIFLPLASEAMFVGDSCTMKSTAGVCKLASQCPELEMAVRSGEISTRDIVNCGFTTREEIICCPSKDSPITENRQSVSSTTSTTTTTPTTTTTTTNTPPSTATGQRDFWSHLLTSTTTTTTTPKPDFWLHLLSTTTSTSTTTTTSTTPKPLIVNGKSIDPDAGFIDLSNLLSSKTDRSQSRQKFSATDSSNSRVLDRNPPSQQIMSVNERAFGWQSPPMGIPKPTPDYIVPQPKQFPQVQGQMGTNSERSFQRGRNGRQRPSEFKNAGQPIQRHTPNQSPSILDNNEYSGWPTPLQEPPIQNRPAAGGNWNSPQFGGNFQNTAQRNPTIGNGWGPTAHVAPQQRQWGNNDFGRPATNWPDSNDVFSQHNSLSENIWPQNAITPNAPKNGEIIQSSNIFGGNHWQNFQEDNPITAINNNLIKSGLDIVKANLDSTGQHIQMPFFGGNSRPSSPPPRTAVVDPFAPFQFRPPPVEDVNSNKLDNGWSDRRPNNFDGQQDWDEDRPVFSIRKSSTTTKKPTADDMGTPSTREQTVTTRTTDRPAVVACRKIDEDLDPDLTPHILGGTPAELGEFPHMAAIGYSSIGNDDGPYDYRCGGTLISNKFVLTAAHCVNNVNSQPAVVLLGLVNIDDPEERRTAVEIRVRRVHIHPDYSNSRTYHDVSLLELEREVEYTDNIAPTCLHTDLNDPPSNAPLYVTGWGLIDTGTRKKSNILLKAKLSIVPTAECNVSYAENGPTRRLSEGITNQQMCAHDPGFTRDACQGDSGGPLNMVVDESLKKYRIVGIISAGFSCGSATPGLYARVAAYLDYIESIVWPNLG